MTDSIHAHQAQMLISIIGALIPLLIWAIHEADQRISAKRAQSPRRRSR